MAMRIAMMTIPMMSSIRVNAARSRNRRGSCGGAAQLVRVVGNIMGVVLGV